MDCLVVAPTCWYHFWEKNVNNSAKFACQIWYLSVPYIYSIMCANTFVFHGNYFSKCAKEKKNKQKMNNSLKAHTSGALYFKSDVYSPLICGHLHSKLGLVWTRDHEQAFIVLCSLH